MLAALYTCKSINARHSSSDARKDLPQTPGLLPKWQLIVAVMAVFNCVQNFVTLKLTRRIYDKVPSASGERLHYSSATVRRLSRLAIQLRPSKREPSLSGRLHRLWYAVMPPTTSMTKRRFSPSTFSPGKFPHSHTTGQSLQDIRHGLVHISHCLWPFLL